jgi:GNAT superfamily N-acetyltransferase
VQKLIDDQVAFFVARHEGIPAGCGGIKLFGTEYGELKRMYVRPRFRGLGIGRLLLDRLSNTLGHTLFTFCDWKPASTRPRQSGCTSEWGSNRSRPFPRIDPIRSAGCYEKRLD